MGSHNLVKLWDLAIRNKGQSNGKKITIFFGEGSEVKKYSENDIKI